MATETKKYTYTDLQNVFEISATLALTGIYDLTRQLDTIEGPDGVRLIAISAAESFETSRAAAGIPRPGKSSYRNRAICQFASELFKMARDQTTVFAAPHRGTVTQKAVWRRIVEDLADNALGASGI